MSSTRLARLSGLLAVVSLAGGVLADVCTFYTTKIQSLDAAMPLFSLENLLPALLRKPAWHVDLGHYLALVFIPMGMVGLYHLYWALQPAGASLAKTLVALGVLGFVTGMAFHLSFGFVAALLQAAPDVSRLPAILARFEPFVLSAASVSILLMTLSFGVLLIVTAMGTTAYPRWFVWLNPLPVQVLLYSLAFILPVPVGSFLIITALNVSLLLFFGASTVVFWDGIPDQAVRSV